MSANKQEAAPGAGRWGLGRLLRPDIRLIWICLPLFVVAWIGLMQPLRLLDFWWHLKAGEVIWTSRAIPQIDSFSFTFTGQPFAYVQYWLGEVIYYLLYHVGGFPLLIAFNAAILVLTIAPILHLSLRDVHGTRIAVLCNLCAAIVLGQFSNMRPQTYAMALFAGFYWILWRYRDGQADHLWLLPLLMVLWVNVHGTFVLGLALIGIVLGAEAVRRARLGDAADTLSAPHLARLALALAATLFAAAVNPEGVRIFAYVRQLQANPAVRSFVTEWQPPSIATEEGVLSLWAPLLLAALVFIYTRRLTLTELILSLAFAVLGLQARRNGIWFALVVTPMLVRRLTSTESACWLPVQQLRGWLVATLHRPARPGPEAGPRRYGLNRAILVCLLLFTVLLSPWVRPGLQVQGLRRQLLEKSTPLGAMDYVAGHNLTGRIFHTQNYGDFLIWRLWPQQRSFFDGRVHLFDASFVQGYVSVFHDPNWDLRLANYGIRYLLLPKDDPNATSLMHAARESATWKVLYEDDVAILFERLE